MPFPDGIREPPDAPEQDDKFRSESNVNTEMSFVHPPDTGQFVPDGFVAVALGTAVKPKTPGIDRELAQPTNASALAVLEPGGPVHEGAESSPLSPVAVVGNGSCAAESPMAAPKEYRVHGTGQLADMDRLVGLEVGLLLDRNLAPEVLLQSLGL